MPKWSSEDRKRHSLTHQGELNGNAKLTEEQVREIRICSGLQREIAARFGITQVMVSRIRLRKAWFHLP